MKEMYSSPHGLLTLKIAFLAVVSLRKEIIVSLFQLNLKYKSRVVIKL